MSGEVLVVGLLYHQDRKVVAGAKVDYLVVPPAASTASEWLSLASLCPAQTSPLGWRSRRRLPLPASLHILNAAMPKAVGA